MMSFSQFNLCNALIFLQCKWSRKGFLRTRWSLNGTVFDLINIHLFHDASNFIAMESVSKENLHILFLNQIGGVFVTRSEYDDITSSKLYCTCAC
jgi:hypothetical protein